jgi:hypothetical protein
MTFIIEAGEWALDQIVMSVSVRKSLAFPRSALMLSGAFILVQS